VHGTLNAFLTYSGTPTASMAPLLMKVSNISGALFIEKSLALGVTNVKFPVNLRSGIYSVKIISNGKEIASQKMYVY
jgi:hypothetical protein